MLNDLMARNLAWSTRKQAQEEGYFARLATRQNPEFFWIGCSDSRVPANVVAGLDPGEVFVHRNVAIVVHSSDMNLLSALEFAVDTLSIREIIVCGHYGCGGVLAATEDLPHGLADHWLEPIRRLARAYAVDLACQNSEEDRRDKLAELNVIEGVRRVSETPILQRAWRRQASIRVHGLIYGLKDGLLRNLDCSIGPDHFMQEEGDDAPFAPVPVDSAASGAVFVAIQLAVKKLRMEDHASCLLDGPRAGGYGSDPVPTRRGYGGARATLLRHRSDQYRAERCRALRHGCGRSAGWSEASDQTEPRIVVAGMPAGPRSA